MKLYIGVIVCLLFSSYVHSEIYKWTDENGRVHFSDKAKSKNADVVDLKQDKPTTKRSPSEQNSLENTRRFLRALEDEKAIKLEKSEKLAEKRNKTAAYCQRLKKEMTIYNKGYAIVRYNEKGEHEYLTDQEIASQKGKFEQKWKEYCEDL